ncbi:response regulator [Streptomyces galbus]|uniref:Response regulator transcription factor n=1 Tax=Streptomyces galbus TaxID=33898 RepID=A0A4U5X7S1_STRGB|nr:response regulator transcription factor [Streptomyces galbus]TKT10980.1 response regulator transcription factor [Streptomyces galbus]
MMRRQTDRPVLRVVVADDNPVVRAGLTALLDGREEVRVVAEASDGREAQDMTRRHRPDLVLLDVRMPGVDGLTALPDLVPLAPVLMLTYSGESEVVREALRRGAGGYLVHGEFTADQLVTAVRDVVAGRAHLTPTAATAVVGELRGQPRGSAEAHAKRSTDPNTPGNFPERLSQVQSPVGQLRSPLSAREAEIMDLIATGLNNHQIAAACFISEKTVKNHINRIFAKLHCATRTEATAKWLGTAPHPTPPSREVG